MYKSILLLLFTFLAACGGGTGATGVATITSSVTAAAVAPDAAAALVQDQADLLHGQVMALAYSGYREGQHPDRGAGAVNPSDAQIKEDLAILVDHGFRLIRLYDSQENSEAVLRLIRDLGLPLKVLLGIWLDAEVSNHENCAWLEEPIPDATLELNKAKNAIEVERGIRLANEYHEIVVALNVGNEALVYWNDHMVTVDSAIAYLRQVRAAVEQPVTTADSYELWLKEGGRLADEVDFIGMHSYPAWNDKTIDEALAATVADIEAVSAALPGLPIAVLEAGWASTAVEFREQASESNQARYYRELRDWAAAARVSIVFFEAFDEPWKGNPDNPDGAEKHWGLFNVDRSPKEVMMKLPTVLYSSDAIAWALNLGGDEYTDIGGVRYRPDDERTGGVAGRMARALGAQDGTVYETFRQGDLRLVQPLVNGVYDITFQFAEPEEIAPGARIFDVLVQGATVIADLDVKAARDGNSTFALDRTVTGVEIHNGQLEIAFRARAGVPLLNGLVVRRQEPDTRQWTLGWFDEFNRDGAPDPDVWVVENWPAAKVNQEDQAYTDRERNLRVEDGKLVIEAHLEDFQGARYTSGRLHSMAKRDMLYGRVDVRARLPGGRGTWAALWMLPSDPFRYATTCSLDGEWHGSDECDAWPNSGEIDIMEHVGFDMHRVHGTVHNRAFFPGNGQQRKGSVEVRDVERAFHIYSVEWTPEVIRVFIDGSPYFSYYNEGLGWEAWPYDHPYHLIFNLAIGGTWGGSGGPIDDSIFPVRMEVDYVRYFTPQH